MSQPAKNPDPPKKPEPRTAGASTNQEDVFSSYLPVHPDEAGLSNDDPAEEKITFLEALKEKAKEARRRSVQMLGLGDKKDDKKDWAKSAEPKKG